MNKFILTAIIICTFSSLIYAQKREPGKWKSIDLNPGVGRIVDVEFDPQNGDRMYAAPDANGIWYTENQGRNWKCITDNIPELEARISDSEIVVDPNNFDKIYYVSEYGNYYITENRGKEWKRVEKEDGTPVILTDFKRTIVSRANEENKLVMVSTTIGRDHGKKSEAWGKGLHTSQDEGKTWKHFPNPSKDDQFLEIAFHPTNSNIIYAPSSNSFYKSTDGGETFENVMDFQKPFGGFSSIQTIESQPNWVYLITSNTKTPEDSKPKTALYLSKDKGETWETIQNMEEGIGYNKSVNGGFAGSWLHCFAVNSSNPKEMITAEVNMVETSDGGLTWNRFSWNNRAQSRMTDGTFALNKFGKHMADNHVIKFHPKYKSRAYKACDSGLYLRDPEIGINEWVQINGDMQTMLFYSVTVNEFGDRYISGNTQDCDVQSHQYGEWNWVRGYEGDNIIIHPYTNTAYFPSCRCGEGGKIEGLFDLPERYNPRWGITPETLKKYGSPKFTSWGRAEIVVNYKNPDEAIVLYRAPNKDRSKQIKKAYHIKDKGVTADSLHIPTDKAILSFNISRTKEERFTAISSDALYTSLDKGDTWKSISPLPEAISYGSVDPDNPDRLWLGSKNGKVYESTNGGISWKSISDGLIGVSILKLIYHEGSKRDLYALVVKGDGQFMEPHGIYYLNSHSNTWRPMMDNFKLNGFSDMAIDYPSQKLIASSYGRGIWETDLMGTYERFLKKNIEIIQNQTIKNIFSFKVDLPFYIPDYYNFKWSINGEKVASNSIYLVSESVKKGDIISCELSPRYSTDIILNSKPLIAKKLKHNKINKSKRHLNSKEGSLDLGYFDIFASKQDFSVGFMLKPENDGVVISNRRYSDHDAKGWMLHVKNDSLVINFSAKYNTAGGEPIRRNLNPKPTEQLRFKIEKSKWSEILIAFDRDGKVKAFLNDQLVAEKEMNKDNQDQSLNSLFNLFLFSDAFGTYNFEGAIDELKIWNKAITLSETNKSNHKDLIFYHSFNSEEITDLRESYTNTKVQVSGNLSLKSE